MKKNVFLSIILLICFLFSIENVYADVDIIPRTEENLLVPDSVVVDDSNRDIILKTPAVDATKKIYDFADLLTDKEEYKLYLSLKKYIKETHLDAIVVTTDDLLELSFDEYVNNFYFYNKFESNAVIFVISVADEKPNLFMAGHGAKAESIYTDPRINETLKYIYNDVKKADYYKAVDDYVNILLGFYNLDREGDYRVNKNGNVVIAIPYIEISIIACSLTIIFIIISFIKLLSMNKLPSSFHYSDLLDSSSMSVKTEKDEIIDTVVSDKK